MFQLVVEKASSRDFDDPSSHTQVFLAGFVTLTSSLYAGISRTIASSEAARWGKGIGLLAPLCGVHIVQDIGTSCGKVDMSMELR